MSTTGRTTVRRLGAATLWMLLAALSPAALADSADEFSLTDEPGNWFRSENTGTPVTVVDVGDRVDFRINNCCTSTRHTVTLLIKPTGSDLDLDQDSSQHGSLSAEFDRPGVYLFVCKIHPYMTAVVAVRGPGGTVPDVTAAMLPFIGHLGLDALSPDTVLSVVTTIAASDADKSAKWDIFSAGDSLLPATAGVGEIWVNSQFERVPGQRDVSDVQKPGTITVVDAATFTVEREINGLQADGFWNNPHNMWANDTLDAVYNSHWFGKWINKIDRASGDIIASVTVGEAPTHIVSIPTRCSSQFGDLTIPISADNDLVKVRDLGSSLEVIDSEPTGDDRTHPHGHWISCGRGEFTIVPNVFTGIGFAGSISIIDTLSGNVLREFTHNAGDPLRSALLMPIAVGECHVEVAGEHVHKAYVANAATGLVTVIDVEAQQILRNIPVTFAPDGQRGLGLLDTLQVPIQTPVSPDGRFVAVAVLSLTTVPRPPTGSPDHVALIDARTDEVVAFLATPAGTHGVNWGAKLGGGYYAYVTNQHANALTVVDPDPDGDGDGADAQVAGRIVLANGSPGAGVTDGTGGQGVKPLPNVHDGWIQPTVRAAGEGLVSAEVQGWLTQLTAFQRNPHGEPQRPGDVDADADVDLSDLAVLLSNFGASEAHAGDGDVDDDGDVDLADLSVLLSQFGTSC